MSGKSAPSQPGPSALLNSADSTIFQTASGKKCKAVIAVIAVVDLLSSELLRFSPLRVPVLPLPAVLSAIVSTKAEVSTNAEVLTKADLSRRSFSEGGYPELRPGRPRNTVANAATTREGSKATLARSLT
jgi:hypothetical protein